MISTAAEFGMGRALGAAWMRAQADESRAELDALRDEVAALRAREAASFQILQAIAAGPEEAARALDLIAETATVLCGAYDAVVLLRQDDHLVRGGHHGPIPMDFEKFAISPRWTAGRCVLERQAIQVHDLLDAGEDFPDGAALARRLGHRTAMSVPLLRGGEAVGSITLRRCEVSPFSDDDIALLAMFADQAVIAIENVRLFEAVQGRTCELEQALEQQIASGEILRAISSSPGDVVPVFETMVEHAARLCDAEFSAVARFDGITLNLVAVNNMLPSEKEAYQRIYPRPPSNGYVMGRAILSGRPVQVEDVYTDPDYDATTLDTLRAAAPYRSYLGVPILLNGAPIGCLGLGRRIVRPFTDREISLVQAFADQAVIAIENARLFTELDGRNQELGEALEQQTATSNILRVISSSPNDVQPVFDAIVESAVDLCDGVFGCIFRFDGELIHLVGHNLSPDRGAVMEQAYPLPLSLDKLQARAITAGEPVNIADVVSTFRFPIGQRELGYRSVLSVPMLRDNTVIGTIGVSRLEAGQFPEKQVKLLQTFSDQAVMAIENVRLFTELDARNHELNEALEQQTATADILRVISSSPTDIQPVFDTVAESAGRLCSAQFCFVFRFDGTLIHFVAHHGVEPAGIEAVHRRWPLRPGRASTTARAILTGKVEQIPDVHLDPDYELDDIAEIAHFRSTLAVPMIRNGRAIGAIAVARSQVGLFPQRQIELLKAFADQAVIAIENVRLFEALQSAVTEFNAVLDNIDYGVLFMDKDLRTRIVNPALRRLWDVPQKLLEQRPTLKELLEYNRDKGVYTTPAEEWDDWVAARIERVRQGTVPPGEFIRADGKVYSYQCVALPDGGRMLSYFDITELKNRQDELLAAKEAAEAALAELRTAQERLVQSEKLASLGQLTAGIAHEIKNPLNFVNNFAALSRDLLEELEATVKAPIAALDAAERDGAEDLLRTVRENLDKVAHHGKRADSIVKNMLLHARQGSGEWREADINAIAEEALNLAYHGARAGYPDFNVEIVKHLDTEVGAIECCPQDVMRVVLNLVSNSIYAANKKSPAAPAGFVPRIELSTRAVEAGVTLEVRDNGTGIPAEIRDSIFLPFFTTKPAGEGTGLGLSLSHDIVVKQHGGSFLVESEPGEFTSFRIVLPRHAVAEERAEA